CASRHFGDGLRNW
nr:immunoglobulin heavy chain junction region [Macaca mulatta]MOW76564.1 immunoglobulin heavy chain junction region [Macaca mulatta]MOW77133.1 immunoglobulin heavy chain junction region [Macaca mulatta]MOW77263.1 immunoglobulin heavy chain junction region [Macaca mulatta]MOW77572.1 immunoglobulin heavy chain junction region [Macaca mulatta]